MNSDTLKDFEEWALQMNFDLRKVSCLPTENPYTNTFTFKAYEAWCASGDYYLKAVSAYRCATE